MADDAPELTEFGPQWGQRCARQFWGANSDAPADQVREILLTQLEACGFVPTDDDWFTLALARFAPDESSACWPYAERVSSQCEGTLRMAADQFSTEFFTLPVERRRERWMALLDASRYAPRTHARLLALRPGLEISPREVPSPRETTLEARWAAFLCDALRKRPDDALQAFAQFIPSMHASAMSWHTALRRLRTRRPGIARLFPDMIDTFGARLTKEAAECAKSAHPLFRWLGWVAVVVVLNIVARTGCSQGSSTKNRPNATPPISGYQAKPGIDGRPSNDGRSNTDWRWPDETPRDRKETP